MGQPKSFEPLPKPRETQPERKMGKGGGGPEAGPQIEGRESEGSCCKGLGLVVDMVWIELGEV